MGESMKFVPFNSMINPGFWTSLTKTKLDVAGLSESPITITGTFTNSDPPNGGLQPRLSVDWDAFEAGGGGGGKAVWNSFPVRGTVVIKNTVEAFKSEDKAAFLTHAGERQWSLILSGAWRDDPSLLTAFSVLVFADLKKYQFLYWFAFPAFNLPKELVVTQCTTLDKVVTPEQEASLVKAAHDNTDIFSLLELGEEVQLLPLKHLGEEGREGAILCVRDPSSSPCHPGWLVRSLMAALWHSCPGILHKGIRLVCLRMLSKEGRMTVSHSIVLTITLQGDIVKDPPMPGVVGWEKNTKGQPGPRMANMRASMDPAKLAENSVDLNLKLMKWRLVPELDLDRIKATRCLLLGSGTLGCGVARGLLGWGVRHITFLDSGRVSYSNPVRQSLFTFSDCLEGGRLKAEAAAARLQEISPGVQARGVVLGIPMPGHPVSPTTEQEARSAYDQLSLLIQGHDLIFLLMDSRESRWLPTAMAALYPEKLVINAALGFDTFLVMRHGVRPECPPSTEDSRSSVAASSLGCYFCNDVVAPGDSTTDRTLDQQCTVTRPGASGAAAALAVELAMSCLAHSLASGAPAPGRSGSGDEPGLESVLGLVPHTVRGSLHGFTQVAPTGPAFSQCTACSPQVLKLLREEGFELVRKVGDNPKYLEDVTGLTELMQDCELMDGVIDLADDDCISLASDL